MGNRQSRKKHESQKNKDKSTPAVRTRSLNSLPQGERQTSKPKPISHSVKERSCVVSEQFLDSNPENASRHKRQNTAPEIIVPSTPRSLKISDFSKVVHQPEVPIEEPEVNIPIEKALEPTPDELCQICSVFTGKIKFLCRVCYQVFHLGCLQKVEQHEPSPVVCYLKRADTELGWSCHQCDNISRLLTESEMALLVYSLEQYNIRQGASIFRQQYLYYKKAAYRDRMREEMPQDKLTDERCIFDKLDTKHTGKISWCDFINSETINILSHRSKKKLVKLLTQAELFRCRQKFLEFDHDRDGEITRFESLKAQMKSYSELSCFPTPTPSKLLYTNEEIGGVMNWMQFLEDQALVVLAARRNSFCKEPVDKDQVENQPPPIPSRTPEVEHRNKLLYVNPEVRNTLTTVVPLSTENSPAVSLDSLDARSSDNIDLKPEELVESESRIQTSSDMSPALVEPSVPTGPPIMRYSRSKSLMRTKPDQSTKLHPQFKRLHSVQSMDQSIEEDGILTGQNLKKSPNVNLVDDSGSQFDLKTNLDKMVKDVELCPPESEVGEEKIPKENKQDVKSDSNGSDKKQESEPVKEKQSEVAANGGSETPATKPDDKNRLSTAEQEADVVRRYPKIARNHTISMYIYESNRNTFGNEIRSIRRPVSVVGFKMEPTETVSRLSMNIKRPASSPHHSILPIIRKEIKSNGHLKEAEKAGRNSKDAPPKVTNKENHSPSKSPTSKIPLRTSLHESTSTSECGVERRERRGTKRLNADVIESKSTSGGKFRASDSEVLKSEKPPVSKRSQTTSLFVTRNEKAVLMDQNDRRPLSLG